MLIIRRAFENQLSLSPFDSANIIHKKALVKSFKVNFFTYFLQENQII